MASQFQEQVFRRKLLYIGLIVVLFSASWAWRRYSLDPQAARLSIREESRGEVELVGSVLRLGTFGFRGVLTCALWHQAGELQKRNELNKLEVLVRVLTKMQPHFISPWEFQSWNLAYNVSVELDRPRDKYFYIARGTELLAEGERQNRNNPDLRYYIGFYTQHKICQSDETNVLRSIFQLALISPNERDPARFWKQGEKGPVFNRQEFAAFCREHPQLVRRLRLGITRYTEREKRHLFTCRRPQDVVKFLEEHYQVLGLHKVAPIAGGLSGQARVAAGLGWDRNKKDTLLAEEDRYPCLPMRSEFATAPRWEALTSDSELHDEHSAYSVSHAWFSYAQEPLPEPDELPGSNKPIADRVRQRKPRRMTALIFRNYPAQALRCEAERLQAEGWFLDRGWDVKEFSDDASWDLTRELRQIRGASAQEQQGLIGGTKRWSLDMWRRAKATWEEHGHANHLLFPDPAAEQSKRELAKRFWRWRLFTNKLTTSEDEREIEVMLTANPPPLRPESLDEDRRREYEAARYMFEYNTYRYMSNFPHHYQRALVEQKEETVATRELFYRAELLNFQGSPKPALKVYEAPVKLAAFGTRAYSPLEAWKRLVLLADGHKEFRRDSFTQEQTAEYGIRYLRLYNRVKGRDLKEKLAKVAGLIPLAPRTTPERFRAPIVPGPFEVNDDEGVPLVSEKVIDLVLGRMGLRQRTVRTPRPMGPPGRQRERQPSGKSPAGGAPGGR
jgi:hypothetical protein